MCLDRRRECVRTGRQSFPDLAVRLAKSTLIIALSPTDIRGGRASVPKQWDDLIRSVLTSSLSKVIESARTSRDRRTKHRPTRPAASIGFDLLNCCHVGEP